MPKKKIIETPRGYISFSQMSMWQSSPERYKRTYFEGKRGFTNSGMRFGSVVADALENEEYTGDLLTDTAMELLPKFDVRDEEIRVPMKTKDGEIILLGRPDSLDSKTKDFYEFKTGTHPWTQKKANEHLQLKFYALMIYLKHDVLLDKCELIWMETFKDPDEKVQPTGKIVRFEVKITLKDILETMAMISRVAKEIELEWVVYEKPKEETLEAWLK